MSRTIAVHLLPQLFEPPEIAGGIAVVVDVLRASTTISYALQNGADGVVVCGSVDDAKKLRGQMSAESCLLGGERGGVKIDGFDLSNSPDDYSPDVVAGVTIGFTTTNGTNAVLRAAQASTILIGSFVNFAAVLQRIVATDQPVHIVCAGTDGAVTGEDVLFAGALVEGLVSKMDEPMLDDSAGVAVSHWRQECGELTVERIEPALQRAQGGRNLFRLGYAHDILTAATPNSVSAVGVVDPQGVIRRHAG